MAINITRDDIFDFIAQQQAVGPCGPRLWNTYEEMWALEKRLEQELVEHNPQACLDALLDIVTNPRDYNTIPLSMRKNYLSADETYVGELLGICIQWQPQIYEERILPLFLSAGNHNMLILGISGAELPESFEWLMALVPQASHFTDNEVATLISCIGELGKQVSREDDVLTMLQQLRNAFDNSHSEIHHELDIYFKDYSTHR